MTEWFNRKPGDFAAQGVDDPTMLLLGDGAPDWVRLPPELGGTQLKVQGAHAAPCPMCKGGSDVRHLELEGNYGVAECPRHGFVWYRRS
jgi:hypothetical protein